MLTKLRIIPKFILSMEETDRIMETFTEQNVTIESQEHLYRLLKMDVCKRKM